MLYRYGRVTFEVAAPKVAGIVTAAILIGTSFIPVSNKTQYDAADEHDEIDVELLGGDANHWQTNIYAPSPKDKQPLWGVFGDIEDFPSGSNIVKTHNYTIDWNSERITWEVDGSAVRTIKKCEHQPYLL